MDESLSDTEVELVIWEGNQVVYCSNLAHSSRTAQASMSLSLTIPWDRKICIEHWNKTPGA